MKFKCLNKTCFTNSNILLIICLYKSWKTLFMLVLNLVLSLTCRLGRSENQKNQNIKNGECFFCVLVYKEQGKLHLV